MKAQMKSADRLKARFTAILGDDELAEGVISLKEHGERRAASVALDKLADEISNKRIPNNQIRETNKS